ncbi:MAG: hypothetical protein ABFC77_12765 [Thermoguttaceae bacterium]
MKRHFWLSLCIIAIGGCGPTSHPSGEVCESPSVPASPNLQSKKHASVATPVTGTLRLANAATQAGDELELSVLLEIAPLWEIDPLKASLGSAATQLRLNLPPGLSAVGEWQSPEPFVSGMSGGHPGYGGEVLFTRRLKSSPQMPAGKYAILCSVAYQACNEQQCLQPAEMELKTVVEIK